MMLSSFSEEALQEELKNRERQRNAELLKNSKLVEFTVIKTETIHCLCLDEKDVEDNKERLLAKNKWPGLKTKVLALEVEDNDVDFNAYVECQKLYCVAQKVTGTYDSSENILRLREKLRNENPNLNH